MEEAVKHFLEGTFHQDMGSPEQALQEWMSPLMGVSPLVE